MLEQQMNRKKVLAVDDLVADLRRLGAAAGDVVMAHASLRATGVVQGCAAGIVDALDALEAAYGSGTTSPRARLTQRRTCLKSVGGNGGPSGPRARKSRSIVVISSQNRIPGRRRPPTPAGTGTRVGPGRPAGKTGITMRSSRNRFLTSSDTMRAGRGWCGSSGWPGV